MNVLNGIGDGDAFLGQAHLAGKSAVRHPRRTLPWYGLLEHLVNLFQAQAFHLGDHEVGEQDAERAQGAPEEEDFGTQVCLARSIAYQVWSYYGNDLIHPERLATRGISPAKGGMAYTVPEPVARSGETHGSRSDRQGKDLAHNDPRRRTPAHGEHGNVEADECNHASHGGGITVLASSDTDNADDELRDHHAGPAGQQDLTSTESLDGPERDGRRA